MYKLFEVLDVDANYLYQDMMPKKAEPERNVALETLAAHREDGYDKLRIPELYYGAFPGVFYRVVS